MTKTKFANGKSVICIPPANPSHVLLLTSLRCDYHSVNLTDHLTDHLPVVMAKTMITCEGILCK